MQSLQHIDVLTAVVDDMEQKRADAQCKPLEVYEGTKGTRVAMALAMETVAKGQQAKSHEPSCWEAWARIAKWRGQEVDAIKENKRRYSIADVKGRN